MKEVQGVKEVKEVVHTHEGCSVSHEIPYFRLVQVTQALQGHQKRREERERM